MSDARTIPNDLSLPSQLELSGFAPQVLDALTIHICVLDAAGRIIAVNRAWRDFAAANPPQATSAGLGADYFGVCAAVTGPDTATARQALRGLRSVAQNDLPEFAMEYACHSPTTQRWFELRATRMSGPGPGCLVVAHTNITLRNQARAGLLESEARFQAIFEQAAVGIAQVGLDGGWLRVNQRVCDIVGYSQRELLATNFQSITHPEDLDADLAMVRQVLAGERKTYAMEKRYLRKDGTVVSVNLTVSIVRSDTGEPRYFVSILEDISSRQQAEAALLESQNLRAQAERMGKVGGWQFDIDTRQQTWTEEVYRIHDLALTHQPTVAEGVGFYTPASRPVIEKAVQRAIEFGDPFDLELEIITAKGNRRAVHAIGNADLKHRKVFGFFQDITERKRAEAELRLAHERWRCFVDANVVGIVVANAAGEVLEANDYYLRLIDFTRAELQQGQVDWRSLTPPEWLAADEQAIRELRARGTCTPYEKEYVRRDGTRVPVLLVDAMLPGPGEPIAAFALDLTERKHAEVIRETLHSLAARLSEARTATDVARSIFAVIDRLWRWDAGTFDCCGADGTTTETVLCLDVVEGQRREVPPSRTHGGLTPRLRRVLANGAELLLRPPDQPQVSDSVMFGDPTRLSASLMNVPIRHQGRAAGVLSVQSYTRGVFTETDLRTLQGLADHCGGALERIQAEAALRNERTLLRTLVDHLPVAAYVKDTAGRKTLVNPLDAHNLGVASPDEALGKTDFDFFPAAQAQAFHADDQAVLQSGQPVLNREEFLTRPDGSTAWLLTSKVPLCDAAGRMAGLVGIGLEITKRRQAEDQLRKLARAVEQSPVSIIITDRAGTIEFVNPKFTQATGYTAAEVVGKNPRLLKSGETSAEEYRQLWDAITAGREWRGEFHNKRKDGTLFWEIASISPVRDGSGEITHYIAVKEDITEKRLTEAKFLRAQRVESIGSLASGIAHDLNNILTPIIMCAPLLQGDESPETRKELAQTIESSAQRAVGIVKQLLTFARGKEGQKQPVQVRHLVRDMAKIARETFPRSIRIEETCASDLWPVLADATQLHQVILNLCVNARDAMPHGGTLALRAINTMLDEHYIAMHKEATPGPFVRLQVSDTGTGIPDAMRDRIFESFFTTKSEGLGTGLGLTTVQGIVRDHKGFITFTSLCGEGTTFEIHLPAAPTIEAKAAAEQRGADMPRGHGEFILVVDDEPAICETTRRALERHGYQVLAAHNGIKALAQFSAHQAGIRAVVTDFMMPLMDGVTLCRTLRAIAPSTPIIVSSGGLFGQPGGEALRVFTELGIRHILHKPHNADVLLQALEAALHQSTPGAASKGVA